MKLNQLKWCWVIILCLIPSLALAQTITVRGTVTDNTGSSLPGVTVLVVNSSRGIITDIDGNYSIAAEAGEALHFSYVGYRSLTVEINGRSLINVTLEEDIQMMDELVVIGYGQQKKATITG